MLRVVRCAGFLLILTTIVQKCRSEAGCPRDLSHTTAIKRFRDSCYQFVSEEKFWFGARDYCRKNGGRLVKIDNAETNDFIVSSLNDLWWRNNGVWIGLHDLHREMHFQWAGHNPYENEPLGIWTNWGRGHPGAFLHSFRDCVRMVRENGQWRWHETLCSAAKWHYRFICQYKAQVHTDGVQSGLTLNSPVPRQHDNSLSQTTTTVKVPTTHDDLTTVEEEIPIHMFRDDKNTFVQAIPDGQNREIVDEATTTDAVTELSEQTMDDEIVDKLKNFYDDPELAEMRSDEVATEYYDTLGRNGLTLVVVLCSAFALSLIVAVLLLVRRRRNQKTVENGGDSGDAHETDKSTKNIPRTAVTVVSNIYVIGDDIHNDINRSSPAMDDVAADKEDVTMTGNFDSLTTSVDRSEEKHEDAPEMINDCGMMGYDMPRPTNVYDEIPELYPCAEAEDHLYESLDDVIAKVTA